MTSAIPMQDSDGLLINDIHNIHVAHVVYTRPQNVVTKSSCYAHTHTVIA